VAPDGEPFAAFVELQSLLNAIREKGNVELSIEKPLCVQSSMFLASRSFKS
jgi:hypothetical protein